MTDTTGSRWLVVAIRLPANPSRHRVAVCGNCARIGAIPLGAGMDRTRRAGVRYGLERVGELVSRAGGHVLGFDSRPRDERDEQLVLTEFNAARAAEWTEFTAECGHFHAEIAKERRKVKFTVAELDEEEQNLDRLRRWFRELRARDLFSVPEGTYADEQLKACAQLLDGYADEVYQAVHAPLGTEE